MSEPRTPEVVGHGRRLITVVTEYEAGEQTAMIGTERTSAAMQRAPQRVGPRIGPLCRSGRVHLTHIEPGDDVALVEPRCVGQSRSHCAGHLDALPDQQ